MWFNTGSSFVTQNLFHPKELMSLVVGIQADDWTELEKVGGCAMLSYRLACGNHPGGHSAAVLD